jgi:hypothetical protein
VDCAQRPLPAGSRPQAAADRRRQAPGQQAPGQQQAPGSRPRAAGPGVPGSSGPWQRAGNTDPPSPPAHHPSLIAGAVGRTQSVQCSLKQCTALHYCAPLSRLPGRPGALPPIYLHRAHCPLHCTAHYLLHCPLPTALHCTALPSAMPSALPTALCTAHCTPHCKHAEEGSLKVFFF